MILIKVSKITQHKQIVQMEIKITLLIHLLLLNIKQRVVKILIFWDIAIMGINVDLLMAHMNLIHCLSVICIKQKNVKIFGKKVTVYMEFDVNLFIQSIKHLLKDSIKTKTKRKRKILIKI